MPLSMAYLIGSAVFFTFSLVYKFFLCVHCIHADEQTLANLHVGSKSFAGHNLISIDIKGMAAGIYFTAVSGRKGTLLLKKIIKK